MLPCPLRHSLRSETPRCGESAILRVAALDAPHVFHGLVAPHVAVRGYGVLVVFGVCELQHILAHFVPVVWISAIFLCEAHGVADVAASAVVACKDEVGSLALGDVAEEAFQLTKESRSSLDVLLWVVD